MKGGRAPLDERTSRSSLLSPVHAPLSTPTFLFAHAMASFQSRPRLASILGHR